MTSSRSTHPRPTPQRVAVAVLMTSLGRVLVWFVPIVLAVPIVLYALIAALGGELDGSGVMMGVANNAPAWFLFAMGASLTTQYLPVNVAHGMTRRSLATALSWTFLAAAALLALVLPIGFVIEAWVFEAYGWTREAGIGLASPLGGLGALIVDAFLRFAAMASIGALAAITYYRCGAWWGSLAALATVGAPGAIVIYLSGDLGAWVAPSVAMAVLAATIAVVNLSLHALVRGATIRSKEAQ
ncbi:hypothetical protein BH23DEI1_BH23DEI1_11680 [soil metagenome]